LESEGRQVAVETAAPGARRGWGLLCGLDRLPETVVDHDSLLGCEVGVDGREQAEDRRRVEPVAGRRSLGDAPGMPPSETLATSIASWSVGSAPSNPRRSSSVRVAGA
jgi:hypothetical protein